MTIFEVVSLITDTTNSLASQYWEGQLRMAVQDGPVRNLFANTGDLYYGHGFEMLASLEAEFKPATFSHTFTTFISLVNDKQAEEGLHEFRARFEGHLHVMSQSAISIPPILQAMLFLRALHPRYKSIVDLFASKQRDISVASINSIILDARFIDEFNFFGSNGNPAPVCDDPLDTASQLESIDDDDYPPAQAPLDEFNPPSDSPYTKATFGTGGDGASFRRRGLAKVLVGVSQCLVRLLKGTDKIYANSSVTFSSFWASLGFIETCNDVFQNELSDATLNALTTLARLTPNDETQHQCHTIDCCL